MVQIGVFGASAKRDRNLTHVGDIADGLDSNPANQTRMYASISYDWHDARAWKFAKSILPSSPSSYLS